VSILLTERTISPDSPAHCAVFSVTSLVPQFPAPADIPATGVRWVLVADQGVAIHDGENPQVYAPACPPKPGLVEYLGQIGTAPCYAAEQTKDTPLPEGWVVAGVRDLYGRIPDEDVAVASFAVRIIGAAKTSRFCGRCGHETVPVLAERAKRCPVCGLVTYPRISPAIIVLIARGEEILLARSSRFPAGMHSLIAGFVDPGETLEHAVRREVGEEVGITVKNVRYFASEPWPFPDSLMIAFVADYATGEIAIDNNEIVAAGWFGRDNLPELPKKLSISRALIDRWVEHKIPLG
jgi:NAD+ diphosphatase